MRNFYIAIACAVALLVFELIVFKKRSEVNKVQDKMRWDNSMMVTICDSIHGCIAVKNVQTGKWTITNASAALNVLSDKLLEKDREIINLENELRKCRSRTIAYINAHDKK